MRTLTTFEDSGYTPRLFGRREQTMSRWGNCPQVRVRAFSYTDPKSGQKEEVPIRVLKGPSPYRQHVLATGLLDPGEIGEYASDFPKQKISYQALALDFEERYDTRPERIPEPLTLTEQTKQLPEQVQDDIRFCINNGIVTITLPLPDDGAAYIGSDEKPPHKIKVVYVKEKGGEDAKDVTMEVLAGMHNSTLSEVYEILANRRARKDENENVDAETM